MLLLQVATIEFRIYLVITLTKDQCASSSYSTPSWKKWKKKKNNKKTKQSKAKETQPYLGTGRIEIEVAIVSLFRHADKFW